MGSAEAREKEEIIWRRKIFGPQKRRRTEIGNDEFIWKRKINSNINIPTDNQMNLVQSAFLKLQQSKAEFCNHI